MHKFIIIIFWTLSRLLCYSTPSQTSIANGPITEPPSMMTIAASLCEASDDIIFQDAGGNDFASIKASKFQTIFYGEQLTYLQSGLEWVGMDFLSGFIKKK
eukprot:964106_1